MNKKKFVQLTKDYLSAIANAPDFIYVDPDAQIPLKQVHLMLETISTSPPEPTEKRDELHSSLYRLEDAGLEPDTKSIKDPPKEQNQNERTSIPLSKALNENL